MRLHREGGRVGAHARRGIGGQAIGTGFRHEFHLRHRPTPTQAVLEVAVRMVSTTLPAPLMTRLRRARGSSSTAVAAVDLSTVVGLAEVDDRPAARTGNPHENTDELHALTATAALMEVDPPVRLGAPSPPSASTRDTKAQGSDPWAFIFRGRTLVYETT